MRGRGEGVRQRVRGELGEWDYVSFFFFFLWFLWFLWFLRGGGRWEDMGKRWGRKDKNG